MLEKPAPYLTTPPTNRQHDSWDGSMPGVRLNWISFRTGTPASFGLDLYLLGEPRQAVAGGPEGGLLGVFPHGWGQSYCRIVKTSRRRPAPRSRSFSRAKGTARATPAEKPGWRHDLVVGLISGALVAAASMLGQASLDDQRSSREERLENLRFVRERSSKDARDRPFRGLDLKGQNLSGLALAGANLDQAELAQALLFGTNLSKATLLMANLKDSRMFGVDLSGANLIGANFTGAELYNADLTGADLSMADLTGADLTGADLGSATLESADLQETRLGSANLARANLARANLTGATLTSAFLGGGTEASACWNASTIWPEGFEGPDMSKGKCSDLYPEDFRPGQ